MTDLEIIETRIEIAHLMGTSPDEVCHIYAKAFSKPHWFFIEDNRDPQFNTLLFFDDKPTICDINEEIQHMKEVVEEWDEEEL